MKRRLIFLIFAALLSVLIGGCRQAQKDSKDTKDTSEEMPSDESSHTDGGSASIPTDSTNKESTDTAPIIEDTENESEDRPIQCEGRSEDSCDFDGACTTRFGYPYDETHDCYDTPITYAGCIPVDKECADDETVANGPDNDCWLFTSSCLPPGFFPAGSWECAENAPCQDPSEIKEIICHSRDEETCQSDGYCIKRFSMRVAEDRNCWGPENEYMGCVPVGQACNDDQAFATDPDGVCWSGSSGCFPGNFTEGGTSCPPFEICEEEDPEDAEVAWLSGNHYVLQIDRVVENPMQVEYNLEPLDDSVFTSVSFANDDKEAVRYNISFSEDLTTVTMTDVFGENPVLGARMDRDPPEILLFNFVEGAFAGGSFLVWVEADGFEADLAIYGSGVPLISLERGFLIGKNPCTPDDPQGCAEGLACRRANCEDDQGTCEPAFTYNECQNDTDDNTVCACSGITYDSLCSALSEGEDLDFIGECD